MYRKSERGVFLKPQVGTRCISGIFFSLIKYLTKQLRKKDFLCVFSGTQLRDRSLSGWGRHDCKWLHSGWSTRQLSTFCHQSLSGEKQEVWSDHKISRPTSVTYFLQLGSTSNRFHNLHKQCHLLASKCSNTRACGGQFTSKALQDGPEKT